MPAGPGEQLLSTLFADCHYYFSHPSSRPPHQRFAKGSYIYLYYNANNYQTKLEVANHAGTPEQDAFYGYLHVTNIRYNHLQPTLVSLLINTSVVHEQQTWHLPSYDVHNQQKYIHKIHALDLYLWTEKDASTFMGHIKTVLGPDRLDIQNAPGGQNTHQEHRDSMSPVVQQLERTAIGTAFPPRTTSAVSVHSFPGPPTPQSVQSQPVQSQPVQSQPLRSSPQATPMAYNPAAPAAPEPVTYREKTPPPPDDGLGTGLKAAAQYDSAPQQPQYASTPGMYQNSAQTTPQHAYSGGPPQQQHGGPSQSSPAPSAQMARSGSMPPPSTQSPPTQSSTPSFGPMAASTIGPQSPPPSQTFFNRQSSYGSAHTQSAMYNPETQYANYPGSPGFNQKAQLPPTTSAPPAYAGHTPMQSHAMPPPPPGQPQQHQQAPYGGFSNYSYSSSQQPSAGEHNQYGGYTGDMHSQAYKPTEAEFAGNPKIQRAQTSLDGTQKPSKLQDGVGKMEGKVGKFFSKLDKLY